MTRVDETVATQPVDITALARANIRAARARIGVTQASVARRMRQLGYQWYPQTCGLVERNQRPLLADELAALALALETTPDMLTLPPSDVQIVTFGGQQVPAQRLSIVDDSVSWDGDDLKVTPPTVQFRPLDLRMARQQDQRIRAGIYALTEDLSGETAPELSGPHPGDMAAENITPRRGGDPPGE